MHLTSRSVASRLITPAAFGFLLTAALAGALAQSIFQVPVQVSDSLEPIVAAAVAESTPRLFVDSAHSSQETLRPMRWVYTRWLLALADRTSVSYNTAFRGAHAALMVALLFIFASALPLRQWFDVAALGVGLTVLIGLHTFAGMVSEAYPINHFAVVAFSCLTVFALARRPSGWMTDIVIILLQVLSLLLVESGVLVSMAVFACALAGLRGIRPRTVVMTGVIAIVYVFARHELGIGVATIGSHGSGYGGTFYSGEELRDRFGSNPLPFLAYNAAGGALSVLFSEPRYGVYQIVQGISNGRVSPVVIINIVSSMLLTSVVGWRAFQLLRRRRREWTPSDQTMCVAAVMLAANAAMCGVYMKDEILSVAGVFYALAAVVTVQTLVRSGSMPSRRLITVAAITLFLAVVAPLWAFRAAGLHFQLRMAAYRERNEWTWVLMPDRRDSWPSEPRKLAITLRLRDEALQRRVASPHFLPRWGEPYWVE